MTATHWKHHLSSDRRNLVETLQKINFGRIEGLVIRGGEPVLDPMPRIMHEFKFQADNSPRPESVKSDFLLKRQVVELFALIDQLGDGVIQSLEVRHGLPFRMTVEEVPA
ncbi:MAG: hypothetical protein NCW75_11485 [Phycisphaera sp.]|nr:MAG: hypothetical protein NCW75_11485 [Phycisphaera sp.]